MSTHNNKAADSFPLIVLLTPALFLGSLPFHVSRRWHWRTSCPFYCEVIDWKWCVSYSDHQVSLSNHCVCVGNSSLCFFKRRSNCVKLFIRAIIKSQNILFLGGTLFFSAFHLLPCHLHHMLWTEKQQQKIEKSYATNVVTQLWQHWKHLYMLSSNYSYLIQNKIDWMGWQESRLSKYKHGWGAWGKDSGGGWGFIPEVKRQDELTFDQRGEQNRSRQGRVDRGWRGQKSRRVRIGAV